MKLALILLALSSSALAQTPAPTPSPAKPVTHHTSTVTTAKSTSTMPKIVGIPKTLYALKYVDIRIGKGEIPGPMKFYTVTYTGWFPDGKKFDSSFDHEGSFTFPYGGHRVITGWDTGFEGMRVGGKRRLFVPYQLAYGITGRPPQMPAKANLIFDVELLSFSDKPPAPAAPAAPRPSAPGSAPGSAAPPATPPAGSTPPAGTTPPPAGAPASGAPSTPSAPVAPATPPPPAAPATPPPAAAPANPATPPTK